MGTQAGTGDAELAPGKRAGRRNHFDARSAVNIFLAENPV
jgi:hypothetical protein